MRRPWIFPNGTGEVRGPDSYSGEGGHFGARRTTTKIVEGVRVEVPRIHDGEDYVLAAGREVPCPFDGRFDGPGFVYNRMPDGAQRIDERYHTLHLIPDLASDDPDFGLLVVTYFYVRPATGPGRLRRPVKAGEILGDCEDLALRYPDPDEEGPRKEIINHVHVRVTRSRVPIDPRPFFMKGGP